MSVRVLRYINSAQFGFSKEVDPGAMAEALEAMWGDDILRQQLNKGAAAFAEANCTDAAAGRRLNEILDSLS